MKCLYCDKKGEWYNPYEHVYYCKEHAKKKMSDYTVELKQYESNTLKDWFIKVIEDDPNLINVTLDTKTGEVSHADNNWK